MTDRRTDEDPPESHRPESGQLDHQSEAADQSPSHQALSQSDGGQQASATGSKDIMILWPDRPKASYGDDSRFEDRDRFESSRHVPSPARRLSAFAAAVIGVVCGAAGGTLTTMSFNHLAAPEPAQQAAQTTAGETALLRDAVARATADISGLRTDLDRSSKTRAAQIGKLGDRLEKIEKFQDDTTTKLAKLGEIQDKLQDKLQENQRVANALSAPETTGSIAPVSAPRPDTKAESNKLATLDNWTVQHVGGGAAIVSGPSGAFEVYPGDPLPGLGRVNAVRYQDGRWVVVTPKGLIVRR